jgi:hypothetical protein
VRVSAPDRSDNYCLATPGTIQTCSYLFRPGTLVTLEAQPAPDSEFMGWGGGCPDPMATTCQVTVTDDITVLAAFGGPTAFHLNVHSVENGVGAVRMSAPGLEAAICQGVPGLVQTCTYRVKSGTVVTLDAVAGPDSVFLDFNVPCADPTQPTCEVPVTQELTVGVAFGGPQPLRVELGSVQNGSGSIRVDPPGQDCALAPGSLAFCDHLYRPGTVVTLTPMPSPDSSFLWLGPPCAGTGPCQITVTDDVAVPGAFVITNRPPVAIAGPDQVVELGGIAILDGSSSSDPDGDPIAYGWRDATGFPVGGAPTLSLTLPLGTHDFTLTVDDARGESASDSVRVVVIDTVAPTIDVTSPQGVTLQQGTPLVISWTASDSGGIASFDVLFSVNGGASFDPVPGCSGLDGSARTCTWTTPGPPTQQARVRVLGRDASGNTGAGEGAFAIVNAFISVLTPNPGVLWPLGSTQTVRWLHNLPAGSTVDVELSRDGGVTWATLGAAVPSGNGLLGSFRWTVSGPRTQRARIRVVSNLVPPVTGRSMNFVIW